MKQILIAVSVLIALGVMAQKGKVTTEVPPAGEIKVVDPNNPKPGKSAVKGDKGDVTMTTQAVPNKPAPKTKGNSSAAGGKEFVSGREMGMERAAEMRAKHAEPKTDKEAKEMTAAINDETKKMLENDASKIADAQAMLKDQLDSKKITQTEYDMKSSMLTDFEARRVALMEGM